MEIFTTEWIADLRRDLATWPTHKPLPPHFNLATETRYETFRHRLEEWVSIFPVTSRKLLISRLRSRKVADTIVELRLGVHLKNAGYEVDYEPNLLGVTPDWLVTGQDTKHIIEVFNASYSGVEVSTWDNIWDLRGRLEQLFLPYAVTIDLSQTPAALNEVTNQQLAQQVTSWLTSTLPTK